MPKQTAYPTGICKACLQIRELDRDGLCADCDPHDEDTRTALLNLLNQEEDGE